MDSFSAYLESSALNVLPFDFVRPSDAAKSNTSVELTFPNKSSENLKKLASHVGANPSTVATAIYVLLVNRLTGDEDVTIAASNNNVNGFARHNQFTKTTKIADIVQSVAKGEDIAVSIDYKSLPNSGNDVSMTSFVVSTDVCTDSPFDLSVTFTGKELVASFNSLLYKPARISYLLDQFVALVDALATEPEVATCGVSLITKSQITNNVIPDPRADLEWDNFRGSIQDVFAANAAKFPERECVVETANHLDPSSKSRSFNYRQIDEASNVIAHQLCQNGIEIDDVVMIYAYRGVDLLLAVMGVLKAGATFSVIDPAYPPARQNIYLSVAKPRALIVLKKAGTLDSLVTDYVKDNLDLKTELIDLEVRDDGEIFAKQDLADSKAKKTQQTGIQVGPDNHPTLSFTSGSEGVPKGVRGRHFSLTYYFPWMGERFGLSEHDKLTMLSGIAHDPIQRDMFTPLFFGARLYVPTADDIGTPGRLAEWFAENGCTVTHLTPAMGQLLNAQATANISSLKNAFFVGDVLTKRACETLQSLAPNTAVINMYGTTETQRAVSYFRVPSYNEDPNFLSTQKDTIAAGQGMLNVQMLVVNRNSTQEICGVGEIGEVYVRAGGLSDGYLHLPDMTAQKFLTSWFVEKDFWKSSKPVPQLWLGPRDRLYRTGDLGRYLPDGNTEVSGRADDQVKIRGFRIELGEINTHLSRHSNVRENITLVRKVKDGEPILVAYVVPDLKGNTGLFKEDKELQSDRSIAPVVKGLIQYQPLLKDIRAYLKTKLPSYAIPTYIFPMEKMPLNPNGKIDKPKLPFPDPSEIDHAMSLAGGDSEDFTNWTESEKKVWDLWLSILPNRPPAVDVDDSFFDLGGHSILATKMIFEARSKLGVPSLPLGAVFSCPTIREFAICINNGGNTSKETSGSDGTATDGTVPSNESTTVDYAGDASKLASSLPQYLAPSKPISDGYTVFLTGATGFLGSYILNNLLSRSQTKRVIVQVRAKDEEHAIERVKTSAMAYGLWKDEHSSKVVAVTGSLESENMGLDESQCKEIVNEVDVVIHNGALVHWVYPYSTLRGPNVIGTINVMKLCSEGKPKYFTFVSSTSVIDTDHYFELSDKLTAEGKEGILESDDLEGSRTGLGTGYGQSKWAAEFLLRYAGEHKGLRGNIVRPGYVVGESRTGVSNTDDFLIRMIKGCQEIGQYPNIENTVNMVPVDHVARVSVASALNASVLDGFKVVQVTAHPRITFEKMVSSLNSFGYDVKRVDYPVWKASLEKFVIDNGTSALFPLLHFVLGNLPEDTKAPEMDDRNARAVLRADSKLTGEDFSSGVGMNNEILSHYVSFLVAVGFMAKPDISGKLPNTHASESVISNFANAGGRHR